MKILHVLFFVATVSMVGIMKADGRSLTSLKVNTGVAGNKLGEEITESKTSIEARKTKDERDDENENTFGNYGQYYHWPESSIEPPRFHFHHSDCVKQ